VGDPAGRTCHLRGDVRRLFFDWLRAHRPELVPLYERLCERGAYAPVGERRRLAALLHRDGISPPSRFGSTKPTAGPTTSHPRDDEQIALF